MGGFRSDFWACADGSPRFVTFPDLFPGLATRRAVSASVFERSRVVFCVGLEEEGTTTPERAVCFSPCVVFTVNLCVVFCAAAVSEKTSKIVKTSVVVHIVPSLDSYSNRDLARPMPD